MQTGEWRCAFCGLKTILANDHVQEEIVTPESYCSQGPSTFRLLFTYCPNEECKALSATISMHEMVEGTTRGSLRIAPEPARTWKLLPPSSARPLPDYVPERIAKEYAEACAVLPFSPSAAATLARRCLQAIIRDFFGVKKNTLADEIEGIKDKLEPELWAIIEETRKLGNVGKNMEKGVNLILDVEPNEPQRLIGLIEYFIEECYVARHLRKQRLETMRGR